MKNFIFSDGHFYCITQEIAELKIFFKNWQEEKYLIILPEYLSVKSLNIIGEDISHLEIVKEDFLKNETLNISDDESPEDYLCYNFYSVWHEKPQLQIIATGNYTIQKLESFNG